MKQRVKDQFADGCTHVFLTSCWGKQGDDSPATVPAPGVPESKDKDKATPPDKQQTADQKQTASAQSAPPAKPASDLSFPEEQSRRAQEAAQGQQQYPAHISSGSSSSKETYNPPPSKPTSGEIDVIEMRPYNPHKAEKDVEVGDYYYKRSNYKGAISRYREALDLRPNYPLATFKLADALEKDKQMEEAAVYYSEYVRQFPDGSQVAAAREALARLAPLIRADAARLKQAEVDHDLRAGEVLLVQKNFPAAVQRFCDVAQVDPDNARAIFRLAQALQATGEFSAAFQNYQTYLKLDPAGDFAPDAQREMQRLAPQVQQGKVTSPSSEIRP